MKLHTINARGGGEQHFFWCPGCGHCHSFLTGQIHRPNWTFDGNQERPTVSPSLRVFVALTEGGEKTLCHLFVRDGQLQFLSDCAHGLAGHTVAMRDIPADYRLPDCVLREFCVLG